MLPPVSFLTTPSFCNSSAISVLRQEGDDPSSVSEEMEKNLSPQTFRVSSGGAPSVSLVEGVYTVLKNNHEMFKSGKK